MGRSKGKSPSRVTHRNAAVLRRRVAAKEPAVPKIIARPEPMRGDLIWPHSEPRPTSEQRAYFNRNLIGAIYWLIIGGLIAAAVCAIAFVAIMKTAGY